MLLILANYIIITIKIITVHVIIFNVSVTFFIILVISAFHCSISVMQRFI